MKHPIDVIASLDSLILKPAPIDSSWILSGQPQARSGLHSESADGASSTNVWDCSAGSFRWYFGWDETILILEGSVKVTSPAGQTSVLKTGHVAYFPAGTTWIWEVDTYVRKLAFHRRPRSRVSLIIQKVRGKLGSRATKIKILIGIVAAAVASIVAIQALD